jgi:hypothetical protein
MRPTMRPNDGAEEQSMIARVLPEFLVDQVQIPFNKADGAGADAAYVIVLLQQQEQLEQGGRVLCKYLVTARLQETVLDLKALVDRLRFGMRIHEDLFLEQLQQHFIETAQIHHGSVIALH